MVAARSLVAGLLVALVVPMSSSLGGEIISAGSSGRSAFESRWAQPDDSGTRVAPGNFVRAGSRAGQSAPEPASIAQPPVELFAAAAAARSFAPEPAASAPPAVVAPLAPAPPSDRYDAFINFGTSSFGGAGPLAVGSVRPWYTSDSVSRAYGYTPDAREAQDFSAGVLNRVESTFARSGLAITATLDPNASASHMLSVTSGLSAAGNPNAVGVTTVGQDGLSFIDKLSYANSPDELMWAVAHNVAHELMHAFGGVHHDDGDGTNLDASIADWATLIDPNTKFGTAAVAEMTRFLRGGGMTAQMAMAAQELGHRPGDQCALCQTLAGGPTPVPEPATMTLWGAIAGLAGLVRARSRRLA